MYIDNSENSALISGVLLFTRRILVVRMRDSTMLHICMYVARDLANYNRDYIKRYQMRDRFLQIITISEYRIARIINLSEIDSCKRKRDDDYLSDISNGLYVSQAD